MTNLACMLWWLIPGIILGWLFSWLFDMLFRRDGTPLIDSAKSDLAAAQTKTAGLESDLISSRNQLSAHLNEGTRLRAELSASRTAHEQAQGSMGILKSELDNRNASLSQYATELSTMQTQFTNARQSYASLEAAVATARAEADDLKRTLVAAQGQMASGQKSSTAANTEITRLRTELAAAVSARDNTQESLSLIETERSNTKTSLGQTAAEAEKLKVELAAAGNAKADIMRSRAALQQELDRTKAELAGLRDAASTASASSTGEVQTLKGQFQALQAEYAGFKDDREKKLTLLQSDLTGHKTSLQATSAELDRLKGELTSATSEYAKLKATAEQSSTDTPRLRAELAAAQARVTAFEKLQREHEALRSSYEASEHGLLDLRSEHDKTRGSYVESQNMIALLQSEIEGNKRTQAALANRTAEMERMMHMEAERRISMTRYGFVPRTRDRDDLTLVEGIGPKIEEVLVAARIDSFTKLAMTPVDDIRKVLEAAGPAFKVANPGTWARQASLVVRGDWAELRRWQDDLIGGVEMPPKSSVQDRDVS